MHQLRLGAKSTLEFGIIVSGEDTWRKPVPRYERATIPGRNGDIITFSGAYENVSITYRCGIPDHFDEKYTAFMNYVLSLGKYVRLEDSYHADVYRIAALTTVDPPQLGPRYRTGQFSVSFDCKPQCYLKHGETLRTYTASGTIHNPTLFDAKPLLRVYGAGTFGIGGNTVTITAADGYTDMDCELEDAYKDTAAVNKNSYVVLSGDNFPTIPPGTQGIELGSGITQIDIVPRWWKL